MIHLHIRIGNCISTDEMENNNRAIRGSIAELEGKRAKIYTFLLHC